MSLLESIEQAKQDYLSYPPWKQKLIDDFIEANLAEPNIEPKEIISVTLL